MLLAPSRALPRRLVAVVVVACLLVALPACASHQAATSPASSSVQDVVRILGSWEEAELDHLRDVVAPFEERTGARVEFETTRDLGTAIEAAIASGDPPDIAGLPGPGLMAELARAGHLVSLDSVIDIGAYKAGANPLVDAALEHASAIDGFLLQAMEDGTPSAESWTRLTHLTRRLTGEES